MNRIRTTIGVCVLALLVALADCSRRPAGPESLVIYFSCDTRGNIEPCGCTDHQYGGLPRRATAIRADGSSATLLVDVGDATRGARDWDKLKFRYILAAMAKLGYAAVNVGWREVELGRDELRRLAGASGPPFVSANVVDAETLKPVVNPYVLTTIDGLRVAITGVLSREARDVGAGLTVVDPEQALLKLLPELRPRADLIVLAANTSHEGMKRLAARLYELDVILGGAVRQPTTTPERVNDSVLAAVADKGKVLGRMELRLDPSGSPSNWSGEVIELNETFRDDPEMKAVIDSMKREQRDKELSDTTTHEDLELIVSGKQAPGADRYVGAASCRECHEEEYRVWHASKHAHAFETLAAKKYEYDRDCLECHVVGLGLPDGYRSKKLTPHLAGVQCESCHGRGKRHVDLFCCKNSIDSGDRTLRAVTRAVCLRCHDGEKSPKYDYSTYWEQIKH